MERSIDLKVITPEKTIFKGEVKSFIVHSKGGNGDFCVMYDHIPLASMIGNGTLEMTMEDGAKKTSTLFGGYAVVKSNEAVILADSAEWPEDIDFERAESAAERARKRLSSDDPKVNRKRAEKALEKAEIRLSFRNTKERKG